MLTDGPTDGRTDRRRATAIGPVDLKSVYECTIKANMRLHVDLFIKYVSNNVYSDNNHGQPQSILNIFLTFFSSLYFITTFCGLFSV